MPLRIRADGGTQPPSVRRGMRWAAQWFFPYEISSLCRPPRARSGVIAIAGRRPGTRTNGDAAWQNRWSDSSAIRPHAPTNSRLWWNATARTSIVQVGCLSVRRGMRWAAQWFFPYQISSLRRPPRARSGAIAIAARRLGTRTNGDAAWQPMARFVRHSSSCPYEFAPRVQCNH